MMRIGVGVLLISILQCSSVSASPTIDLVGTPFTLLQSAEATREDNIISVQSGTLMLQYNDQNMLYYAPGGTVGNNTIILYAGGHLTWLPKNDNQFCSSAPTNGPTPANTSDFERQALGLIAKAKMEADMILANAQAAGRRAREAGARAEAEGGQLLENIERSREAADESVWKIRFRSMREINRMYREQKRIEIDGRRAAQKAREENKRLKATHAKLEKKISKQRAAIWEAEERLQQIDDKSKADGDDHDEDDQSRAGDNEISTTSGGRTRKQSANANTTVAHEGESEESDDTITNKRESTKVPKQIVRRSNTTTSKAKDPAASEGLKAKPVGRTNTQLPATAKLPTSNADMSPSLPHRSASRGPLKRATTSTSNVTNVSGQAAPMPNPTRSKSSIKRKDAGKKDESVPKSTKDSKRNGD